MISFTKQDALDYHSTGKPGKIEVIPTKSYSTQRDLSLAYSPGVADPCLEIEKNPNLAYSYTAKGNLVAVITDGTAVLGLGNIGPLASKPVMEGKGMLFKIYANIDVFDIELDAKNPDEFVNAVKALAPTFGGINLEDIKAPECFEIEDRLKAELDIPLMHDDQHGTAIISSAALLNACEITGKELGKIKVVINGAGAAAVSCGKLYISLGVKKEHITMLDSKGVISTKRDGLTKEKQFFAIDSDKTTLEEVMQGADMFLGLSKGNIVSKEMVQSMAENPIVFALANPIAEISYEDAMLARDDLIMATGRSDTPNQVNNVLGFPYIFRGALDVRSTKINEEMKLAAVNAIANLAKEPVPESVNLAYGAANLTFGRTYIIPKPTDPRLIYTVSPAVAKAAIESGVAKRNDMNWDEYVASLMNLLGSDNKLIRTLTTKAKSNPKSVIFVDADNYKILKAAYTLKQECICNPILMGDIDTIKEIAKSSSISLKSMQLIDPRDKSNKEELRKYSSLYFERRQRKGVTLEDARQVMKDRNHFGAMMVHLGKADAILSGITKNYETAIKPALKIIGVRENVRRVAGMYIVSTNKGICFFADATVNVDPTTEDLIDITLITARAVSSYGIEPRIAMLSYSNFGSSRDDSPLKVQKTVEYLHKHYPELTVDGEIQANFAANRELLKEQFPFSRLTEKRVNTYIFPNLSSGNISYKLMQELGGSEVIGPILMGLNKPMHILPLGCSVKEIMNLATIAVVEAQANEEAGEL